MLTISEISQKTDMAETTLRRYAAKFPEYLRPEKQGNTKRYSEDTLELFKLIYLSYQQKEDRETIEQKLSQRQGAVYEIQQVENTEPQNLVSVIKSNTEALKGIKIALEEIAQQRRKIEELRQMVESKKAWGGFFKRKKKRGKHE